jgi:DNA-binding transcriptional LysR family regulator
VEASVFLADPWWLVCRPDNPLAKRRKVRWSEIDPRTFIGPTRDFRRHLLPQLDARTRERMANAPGQDVSYLTTALGLVMAGEGVTAGPSYATRLVRAYGLRMIQLGAPVFARRVSVYRAARRAPTPAASAFIDTLREFMRAHPQWEKS